MATANSASICSRVLKAMAFPRTDALDTDNGPNGMQNFQYHHGDPASTTVSGTLNSAAAAAFEIDIYPTRAAMHRAMGKAAPISVCHYWHHQRER